MAIAGPQMEHKAPGDKHNRAMQGKDWFLTSYEEKPPAFDEKTMKYMIYQREKCPTTDRLHWHAYIEFASNQRTKAIRKLFPNICAQLRKRTRENCVLYCSKERTRVEPPVEHGVFEQRKQGKRTDRLKNNEEMARLAIMGKFREIDHGLYIRNNRGIKELYALHLKPVDKPEMKVFWWWGTSSTGKSTTAIKHARKQDVYAKILKLDRGFFDPYENETAVVLDEFDKDKLALIGMSNFLTFLRPTACHVRCSGISKPWLTTHIWITSHENPRNYFGTRWEEVHRRLFEIRQFTQADIKVDLERPLCQEVVGAPPDELIVPVVENKPLTEVKTPTEKKEIIEDNTWLSELGIIL